MALQSAPYYWLKCDGCGDRADYGDFSAMDSAASAIDLATDSEWTMDGEKHHCPRCPILTECERCGKPAGDLAGDRDYYCAACWAELEAEDGALATASCEERQDAREDDER
jgi:hypothetical protein